MIIGQQTSLYLSQQDSGRSYEDVLLFYKAVKNKNINQLI